jgi:hypothetical protein
MRIRVTTRADSYEKRKQEHIEHGNRIEDERPIPVNGSPSVRLAHLCKEHREDND